MNTFIISQLIVDVVVDKDAPCTFGSGPMAIYLCSTFGSGPMAIYSCKLKTGDWCPTQFSFRGGMILADSMVSTKTFIFIISP